MGKKRKGRKFEEEEEELELENGLEDELMYEVNGQDRFKKYRDLSSVKRIMDTLLNCENGGVLITSYVGLRIYEEHLLDVPWGYVVLDEGHKIKNPNSNITILAKRLKTPHRIILSGTPIQNNLLELWSLFDFVYPGRLGTLPVFLDEFETPIKVGGYANATNLQVKVGYQKAVILKDLIQSFLLRRMKVDVARDLPSKSEYVLMCRLTKFQKEKYLEFLRSLEFKATSYLGAITTLRKICNHPDLVDLRFKDIKKSKTYGDASRSGKLQVLKNLLKLWKEQGHKVLLFTQTKQMLYILEKFLVNEYGPEYKFMKMSGETPIGKRQDMIHTFNNTDFDLFLLTTKVGGLGVNLTGADRVIIFDPDWNPSTDLQARERAWRLGQKKDVVIYRLVIGGAIEEKIYHRQIFKMLLTDKILKDPNQKRGGFKNEELRDLFTLTDFQDDHGGADDLLTGTGSGPVAKSSKKRRNNEDDLEDLKSIQGLSKMEKYKSEEKKSKEEDSLMSGLFKGTAKISKHDDIYQAHAEPQDSFDRHLETQAKNEADKALDALKKSRKIIKKSGGVGVPTFTGRFGTAGKISKLNNKPNSSASILANLKQKSAMSSQQSTPEPSASSSSDIANSKTLDNFIKFLQSQPGNFSKSKDILQGCSLVIKDNKDLTLMRTLLKGVCVWDQLKSGWVLKEEYR
ncbi:hypothetical protein WICPIJ_005829 [Wickerhamomyces pijperi]|uniref:DNA helicase n=1 Tax=Wickerhamomyces pijperi TaxID=599730 RepID=A0A9P8Q362_WICPI|nr:hypothetical protein WICPIJ_005829 [Wickerhamomyces pijperi]